MGQTVELIVSGRGGPIAEANVRFAFQRYGARVISERTSDERGRVTCDVRNGDELTSTLVIPRWDYWPTLVLGNIVSAKIECPSIPFGGPLGWWHRTCGIFHFAVEAGSGVGIGVVDGGFAHHEALPHIVRAGDGFGSIESHCLGDAVSHGTHVAGIIGGRPCRPGTYSGISPGANLTVARVFKSDDTASSMDIADAIDELALDYRVDLINLSLGAKRPSNIILDAIRNAYEHGALCIAAAGNDRGAVQYPAAFDEVVAVGALGLVSWAPLVSQAAKYVPTVAAEFAAGGLFVATFSARGPQVDVIAPGVGIISTVPGARNISTQYAPMSGASMAAPMVCGVLARRLSVQPDYLSLPRNSDRAEVARAVLGLCLRDLGFEPALQGCGIPQA